MWRWRPIDCWEGNEAAQCADTLSYPGGGEFCVSIKYLLNVSSSILSYIYTHIHSCATSTRVINYLLVVLYLYMKIHPSIVGSAPRSIFQLRVVCARPVEESREGRSTSRLVVPGLAH